MLTLGIETSGQTGSVALVDTGRVLAETPLSLTGRRHARTLVSELKAMFDRVGNRPSECECVAVSIGPGSFTGLRVGCVCAKTLAYSIGCPIVAVESLTTIAAGSPAGVASVVAVVDAMRGEVFAAQFVRNTEAWERRGDIQIVHRRELETTFGTGVAWTGTGLSQIPAPELPAHCLPEVCWIPQARQVALIGEREAVAGKTQDAWSLEPLYIRRVAAEEQAERRRKE
ncbi:MAG: tRNA (adenosine(37)-N6)-threonylcarbamoyltransferase complex dimerization subunit type 1 TsaB [Planctomycetaceae bacterium]|nr:tRNA (adenosine(37)-N6)-threonylcarbamoyltransferase complex dimerization subunit type 1 TsaB [Planctomycetaceae bacterium]